MTSPDAASHQVKEKFKNFRRAGKGVPCRLFSSVHLMQAAFRVRQSTIAPECTSLQQLCLAGTLLAHTAPYSVAIARDCMPSAATFGLLLIPVPVGLCLCSLTFISATHKIIAKVLDIPAKRDNKDRLAVLNTTLMQR